MQKAIESRPPARSTCSSTASTSATAARNGINVAPAAGGSANVAIQDCDDLQLRHRAERRRPRQGVADALDRVRQRARPQGARHRRDQRLRRQPPDRQHRRRGRRRRTSGRRSPAGRSRCHRPAGTAGTAGRQGPQGEPAIKLLLAASQSSVAAKAGKAVAFSYAATARAKSTLTILKGTKKIAP